MKHRSKAMHMYSFIARLLFVLVEQICLVGWGGILTCEYVMQLPVHILRRLESRKVEILDVLYCTYLIRDNDTTIVLVRALVSGATARLKGRVTQG